MRTIYFLFSLIAVVSANAQSTQLIGNTLVTIDTLADDMQIPWEIRIQEDGQYMWVTERDGIVSRINLQTEAKTTVLDLTSTIQTGGESGLLGLALHPDFGTTPEVFLVYTYGPVDNDGYYFEKLVKYTFNGSQLVDPEPLIEDIPAWINHSGSRLFFLPDNTLLMSTGERYQQELAQDTSSLAGKYLRVNIDGSVPADNPFPGSYVYTTGHRNSQGITMLPSGKLITSEHGPSTDDELGILIKGKNYGWPLIHGFCDEPFENTPCATGFYTEPIHTWSPTIATSDLVYYQNEFFPEWHNRLLMTTLNGQRLVTMQLNSAEDEVTDEDAYFNGQFGRLRDIAIGPNKEIYIATNNGPANQQSIIRITPPTTVGVSDLSQQLFSMVPNPAKETITIQHPYDRVDVTIFNSNGQPVKTHTDVEPTQVISLITLDPGIYFVELSHNEQAIDRQRLIKY